MKLKNDSENRSNGFSMDDCVFCNIINRTVKSDVLYEDDDLIIIKDIMPKAPVHVLIIPKKHIASVSEVTNGDKELLGSMVLAAKRVAEEQGIGQSGYKLVYNVGKHGGQTVPHLHLHVLGGKQLLE